MGISKITYGSGDNKFEISYIDNEVIAESGANSYMSNNFEANSFAAYQNKSQTQFFEAGDNTSYSGADEHNCMWRKWDGNNKTDLFPGADNPDGYYTFNCLLTDYNGRRIITELTDIQRVVWRPEIMEEIVNTRINGVLTNVNTYRINTNTNQYYCDIIDATNPTHYTAQGVPISPWLLYPQDKKQLQLHYSRHDGISPWGSSCTREAGVRNTGDNNARTYPLSTAMVNYDVPTGNNQNFGFYSDDNKYLFHCTLSTNNYASGDVRCYICSEDELKKWLASSGLKFIYKGRMYKPVAENNVIVGYTDDLSSKSDWDDWHTKDDHDKPVTPPSGGGGTPGEWDDMPGSGSSIGALAGARCYICSKTDITNLKTWMSKTEGDGGPPDGYDVLSSLISVMAFPIDMTPASSGPAQAISFAGLRTATDNQLVNIASALLSIANSIGATPKTEVKTFTSTATALPSAGNPFTIDLGTCTCPTFYSSDFPFADYDASVELYLPFIGTMSLDTQTVMGNNLHAYMSVDPITGAIYAWCECTKNGSRVVVASGAGAIGVNTPITANQVGMAMAQIKNNAAQSRQTAIQSALTLGVGAFAGMDKNISSILSRNMTAAIGKRSANMLFATAGDYADALSVGASQAAMTALPNAIGANLNTGRANRQIAQANHNSVSGSAGGSTADWSCSYTPYLKIITPDVHRAGEQYEHTYGVPTILSGTLSTFKGLTFCANPDVSSISTATDQEKQQIFGLLAGGVYV